jgi:hypothetical protein
MDRLQIQLIVRLDRNKAAVERKNMPGGNLGPIS